MIEKPVFVHNLSQVSSIGLGTAPIGDLYHPVSAETAIETVRFALKQGITLFDTAPLYGLGLAEERLGLALQDIPRSHYIISTKIGRVLNQDQSDYHYDYSYDGVMRSLEGSLKRLGMDHVDILHIHEADPNTSQETALAEAFPTLAALREQGIIKAIGAGMNEWSALEQMVHSGNFDFDLFLLAGRYTLLEQGARPFLNLCQEKGIGIFAAGVYNSGILATGPKVDAKYNYANAPQEILAKAKAVQSVCERYGVPLGMAALQFVAAHPAVTSLVIGMESPKEIEQNLNHIQAKIPVELWITLQDMGLLDRHSPIP